MYKLILGLKMFLFEFGLIGGLVGGLIIVGLGFTLVIDLGNVARVTINVIGDNLLATIGKNDPVAASGFVTFTSLVLTEIIVVVVLYSPVKLELSRGLKCNSYQ